MHLKSLCRQKERYPIGLQFTSIMAPGARDLWFYCSTPVTGTHSPFLADAAPAIKRISKKRDVAIPSGGVEHPCFVGCEVIGFAKEVKNAPRIAFSCQCGEAVFLLAIHTFFRNWAGLAMTAPGRQQKSSLRARVLTSANSAWACLWLNEPAAPQTAVGLERPVSTPHHPRIYPAWPCPKGLRC